jgi:hypothetical protein
MSAASRAFLAGSSETGINSHFRGELPKTSQAVIEFLRRNYEEKS